MKQTIATSLAILLIVTLITVAFTIQQVTREQQQLTADLQYRTTVLANSIKDRVEAYLINSNFKTMQSYVKQIGSDNRIAGISVYDSKDNVVAASESGTLSSPDEKTIIVNAMDSDKLDADFASVGNNKNQLYVFAVPLHQDGNVIGALVIEQNTGYINDRMNEIWANNLIRLGVQATLVLFAIALTIRVVIYGPIMSLVDSIKLIRSGTINPAEHKLQNNFLLQPLIREVTHVSRSLFEARHTASEEARMRLEKLDSPWTSQRLQEYVKNALNDRKVFVVSNREPYIHKKEGNKIGYFEPAAGPVTALEPILKASGGLWIAHGSGNADKLVVDKNDKIRVPPDEPKYTLKRVWLTEEEEKGYYYGFANEGLWPLCHTAHTRPVFRESDWNFYKVANGKFAEALLKEIRNVKEPIIFIQDYHFTVLPRIIKNSRPDAKVALFWHIPWPNPEVFGICPFREEILDGLLGADLLGFHTQLHCNNFMETAGRELESLIAWEQFSITRKSHVTYVKPFPISVPYPAEFVEKKPMEEIRKEIGVGDVKYIALGVDRLDYTKGIIERLQTVETLLDKYPSYRKNLTLLQVSPPSRSQIKSYREFAEQVDQEVQRINSKFQSNGWKPIQFVKRNLSHREVYDLYRIADVCLVTSLHDGMNMVAKEFVTARDDEKGVLILSKFAGASRELKDALVVNPYDIGQMAEEMNTALQMSRMEQKNRMEHMRKIVENNNAYRWASDILRSILNL